MNQKVIYYYYYFLACFIQGAYWCAGPHTRALCFSLTAMRPCWPLPLFYVLLGDHFKTEVGPKLFGLPVSSASTWEFLHLNTHPHLALPLIASSTYHHLVSRTITYSIAHGCSNHADHGCVIYYCSSRPNSPSVLPYSSP